MQPLSGEPGLEPGAVGSPKPVCAPYLHPASQVWKPNTQLALSYIDKPSTFMTINMDAFLTHQYS